MRIRCVGAVALAVSFAVVLAGCLTRTAGPAEPTGTVRGTVLAGPTCPVETEGGTGCDPMPVQGDVQFWDGRSKVGDVTLARDGTFTADVPLGTYTVRVVPAGDSGFPVCRDSQVTVVATGTPPLSLECDTGIR